jgi:preprotein translocase subunit SecD
MSSDYIPRLRSELLRAGATRQRRWRPALALRPLAVATAVAALAVAAVIALPLGSDERAVEPATDAVTSTYTVDPPGAAEQTAQIMRDRLAAAGIDGAEVSVTDATLTITAPAAARADVATLVEPGRIAFYDWEGGVLGPNGKPEPGDTSVTGDPDAGTGAAVTKAQAQARAARAPGARVVEAQDGSGWFALGGTPALTNDGVADARASGSATGGPWTVKLDLDPSGVPAFQGLVDQVAQRGEAHAPPNAGIEDFFHFAIVIDDRVASVPFVDFNQPPDDAHPEVALWGGTTERQARDLASVIDTGPLPATLR